MLRRLLPLDASSAHSCVFRVGQVPRSLTNAVSVSSSSPASALSALILPRSSRMRAHLYAQSLGDEGRGGKGSEGQAGVAGVTGGITGITRINIKNPAINTTAITVARTIRITPHLSDDPAGPEPAASTSITMRVARGSVVVAVGESLLPSFYHARTAPPTMSIGINVTNSSRNPAPSGLPALCAHFPSPFSPSLVVNSSNEASPRAKADAGGAGGGRPGRRQGGRVQSVVVLTARVVTLLIRTVKVDIDVASKVQIVGVMTTVTAMDRDRIRGLAAA